MRVLLKDHVIFGWGAGVFACTQPVWQDILTDLANFNGTGLDHLIEKRCERLSDAPFRYLGSMTVEEAKMRLEARVYARNRHEEPPPVERKRFEQPKLKGAGGEGDSRSATPSPKTVKRQKPASPHAKTVANPVEKKNRK